MHAENKLYPKVPMDQHTLSNTKNKILYIDI